MSGNGNDIFERLQERLDSWAGEISEARSSLTEQVTATRRRRQAFFRLDPDGSSKGVTQINLRETESELRRRLRDKDTELSETIASKNDLQRKLEDIEARVAEYDRSATVDFVDSLTVTPALDVEEDADVALLEETRVELDRARESLLHREQDLERTHAAIDEVEVSNVSLERAAEDLKAQLAASYEARQALQSKYDALQSAIATSEPQTGLTTSEYLQVQEAAEESAAETARIRSELVFARAQLSTTLGRLQNASQAAERYERHSDEAAQAVGRLEMELDTTRERLDGKDTALHRARAELNAMYGSLWTAEEAEQARRVRLRPLVDELDEKEVRIQALERRLAERPTDGIDRDRVTAIMGEGARSLGLELESMTQAAELLHEEMAGLRAELDQRTAALASIQGQAVHAHAATQEIESANGELREELAALRASVDQREQAMEETIADLLQSFPEDAILQPQLDELQAEAKSKAATLVASQELLEDLENKLEGREHLEQAIKAELVDLRRRLAERDSALAEVRTISVKVEQQGHDAQSLNEAMKAEIESLRALNVEKDFALYHAHEQIDDMSARDLDESESVQKALETTVIWRKEAKENRAFTDRLSKELRSLRASTLEKDEAIRETHAEVERLSESLRESLESGRIAHDEELRALRADLDERATALDDTRREVELLRADHEFSPAPRQDAEIMGSLGLRARTGEESERPKARAPQKALPSGTFAPDSQRYLIVSGRMLAMFGAMTMFLILTFKGQADAVTGLPHAQLDAPFGAFNMRQFFFLVGALAAFGGSALATLGYIRISKR